MKTIMRKLMSLLKTITFGVMGAFATYGIESFGQTFMHFSLLICMGWVIGTLVN